jgi:RNA polymerase sigma-70 factor (ECF subfamily)
MTPNESFTQLMSRLKEGDQAAAAEVFGRYTRRLVALAASQFDSWIRLKVDVEGVVQSALKSFFVRQGEGQFETLADWDNLWGLLTVITIRKCYRRHEYLHAECRDPAREVARLNQTGSDDDRLEAIDREPTPLEAAMLAETVEGLLKSLAPPERAIVELCLQGYSTTEIAARLNRSQRTVRRVRDRVKHRLEREGLDNPGRPDPARIPG